MAGKYQLKSHNAYNMESETIKGKVKTKKELKT